MNANIRLMIVSLLLLRSGWLPAQELIVRLAPAVSVAPAQKGAPQPYLSSDAGLQQLLDQHPPKNISTLFDAPRRAALPEALRNLQRWRFASAAEAETVIQKLTALPGVIYAEPNRAYRVSAEINDPLFSEQWYLQNINAPAAWDIETGQASAIVGVIDTGIDYRHEDLQGQLWVNSAEDLNGNGILDSLDLNGRDEDGNGYIDDVIGWDFTDAPNFPDQGDYLEPDNDPMDEFGSGHGTPVAGIIAARQNNNIGVSGAAPGARMMALRAGTASGFLEEDDVAEAILYAIDNGCQVVNMSFGDNAVSYLLRDAIQYGVSEGVIFVASAGNSGNASLNYPAAFDETISVGATDSINKLAGFSNYGSKINLVAPGVEVFSTQIGNAYGINNGTSFSAPLVCAALALILSHFPHYTPEQAKGALYAGCRDLGYFGWDPFYGHGLVDLQRSLTIGEQGYAEIIAPATGSGTAQDEIAVMGTVFGPRLISYSLAYGSGENPFHWTPITEVFGVQALQDTLTVWNLAGLPDGTYTLELRLKQYGLNEMVHKTIFAIDHTSPTLSGLDTIGILIGPQNGFLIRFQTDDPTVATLFYRNAGRAFTSSKSSQRSQPILNPQSFLSKISQYFQDEHNFILSQEDISGEVEFYLHLRNSAGLEAVYDNEGQYYPLHLAEFLPPQTLLSEKEQLPVSGFFMPFSTDFNENQRPEFVISELIGGSQFGPLQAWEYLAGQWATQQLTGFPLIPRDAAKIHPAGGLELLGGYGGSSLLLGGNAPGEFPNAVVWQDTANFWASRLINLDGDPEPELLALNFGRWKIFDVSAAHRLTLRQTLPGEVTPGNNQFGVPWAVVDDFDGDGRREIAVEDTDGDLYIYEEDAVGQYQFIWSTRLPGRGGNSLLQAADLEGDGQKELISAVRNLPEVLRESNVNSKFWALTAWKSAGNNTFEKIGQQNVHGVTVQPGIHNGLSAADLDGDERNEIIFTPFPDAYVLQFEQGKFSLAWYREGVNSNLALAEDFDRNGLPEVLMNTDAGILRLEAAANPSRPSPPLQLQAVPLDTTTIRLSWRESAGSNYYKIYRKSTPAGAFALRDSTQSPAFADSLVNPDTLYTYAVTRVDFSFPEPESAFSNRASAQPNAPPVFLDAEPLSARQVRLRFNEAMSDAAYLPENYRLLIAAAGQTHESRPASAIRGQNRREVLLSFLEEFPSRLNHLEMAGLGDLQGTPLPGQPLLVSFEYVPPGEPFYLQSVHFAGRRSLRLKFSRELDPLSAQNPENYFLEPDGEILQARLDSSDARVVHLSVSSETRLGSLGVPYYLTVTNMKDAGGFPLDNRKTNRLAIIISAESLAEVLVYPNPYHRQAAQNHLMFANLPKGCEIFIFNASGQFLQRLEETSGSGGVAWDLRTRAGDLIGSGVYIYVARFNGEKKKGKFMVIR